MSDIDDIRERKLEELREEKMQEDGEDIQRQKEQVENQKESLLKQHLEDGARRRLNNVQMAKPEFGEQVEQQILQLIQTGQVQQITEDQMKEILQELDEKINDKTDYNIKGM